ncbi:microtubule-associated tyrosine carboxypeptidase 1-like [Amphiura filiformis]|uniref:microtubule-associated tyrosine carboxypeptidase 1-like n=1 Tax=Amphiura filiformis TaxID=82378 RepID=UPI003B21C6C7
MKRKQSRKLVSSNHQQQKKIVFQNFEETPNKYRSNIDPINLEEQKLRFLHDGITPQFQFKTDHGNILDITNSKKGQIRFDYLSEATRILEKVRMKFGCGDRYMEEAFGESIECDHASAVVARYMKECGVEGMLTVSWSKDLSCSGCLRWFGPCNRYNKPEARKYSLWMKNSLDNAFLRDKGIKCLADHEIGTHFLRNLNDGLQPWFSDRPRFGLRGLKSQGLLETEEGLAAINTLLQSNHKMLFFPALTYYTACKATEMSFQELFDHLQFYIRDCNLRWKYVMRVKRGLHDTNDVGGYGKDQCYFTGAVDILRNIDKIDFNLLYSGKVCIDELPRVKRIARLDCLKLPNFMRNMDEYRKQLKYIATVNGLQSKSAKKSVKLKSGSRRNSSYRQFSMKSIAVNNAACTGAFDSCDVQSETDKSESKSCKLCNSESDINGKCVANCCNDDVNSLSSSFAIASPSRADAIRIAVDDQTSTRATVNDSPSISSAKTRPISEYKGSGHLTASSQSFCPSYTWQSVRTPSPAMSNYNDDCDESPIPYSPSRWLRRRKMDSPNLLQRKQNCKDPVKDINPTSIVRF